MQNQKLKTTILSILVSLGIIGILWPLFTNFKEALTRAQWFGITEDEAYFSEVIEVLSQTGQYRTWDGELFSPFITAGPPFILPATLLKILGLPAPIAGRLISMLFALGAFFLIYKIISIQFKKQTDSSRPFALALGVGIFAQGWSALQNSTYFLYGVFGESAALFFMIATFYSVSRQKTFFSGVFSSLAVLSKPYMVFLPLATLLSAFSNKRKLAITTLGCTLPVLIWFTWMAVSLGGVDSLIQYWIDYPNKMGRLAGTESSFQISMLVHRIYEHFTSLPEILRWRGLGLLLSGLTLGVFSFSKAKNRPLFLLIISFLVFHGIWWIFMNSHQTPRYFMPIVVPGLFLLCFLATQKFSDFIKSHTLFPKILFILLAFFTFGFSAKVALSWKEKIGNYDHCAFCRQLAVQEYWKATPSPRPTLWTSTQGYLSDTDYLFTAPREIQRLDLEGDTSQFSSDRENWVVYGEIPPAELHSFLVKNQCHPVFTFPNRNEGFWSCPKK